MKENNFFEIKFRQKPYTSCQKCYAAQTIKCKDCNKILVSNFLRWQDNIRQKGKQSKQKSVSPFCRPQVEQRKCVVTNRYDVWILGKKQKKIKEDNSNQTSHWPVLKPVIRQQILGTSKPKYETWNSKLIKRFKGSNLNLLRGTFQL